jgi:hypothetical protein
MVGLSISQPVIFLIKMFLHMHAHTHTMAKCLSHGVEKW